MSSYQDLNSEDEKDLVINIELANLPDFHITPIFTKYFPELIIKDIINADSNDNSTEKKNTVQIHRPSSLKGTIKS
jgi:hypothetical protein